MKNGFTVSTALVLGATAAVGSVSAQSNHCDVLVDASSSDADAATIQAGVDLATAGETVCVADGTYTEQVVIDKDLVLTSTPGSTPTIVAPATPTQYTIAESGATWAPVVFAYGGTESGGNVTGAGTVDVSISGFTIDGADRDPGARAVGIFLRNVASASASTVAVESNVVQNMGVGGRETFGILVYGDSSVAIHDNEVSEYERGGIAANGNGTDPAPTVDIVRNVVSGSTGIGEAWAPNGIQVGYGAAATIDSNVVSDNRWSADSDGNWSASGILVFESDDVQVKRNTVTNSDVAISVSSWGWFRPSADETQIVQNEIHEANAGIVLQAVAWDGYSSTAPSVSNSKVTNNVLTDANETDDDVGIAISASDRHPTYDPTVLNNKVIANTIEGYATEMTDDGSETKTGPLEP